MCDKLASCGLDVLSISMGVTKKCLFLDFRHLGFVAAGCVLL